MDILRVIEELESLVEAGTRVPGFRKKVLVDIDHIAGLGDELRRSVPANIQEAHEVLSQKDSILNQAQLEAQRIKNTASDEMSALNVAAQQEHDAMVEETEVVKAADTRSQEIKDEAMMESALLLQDAQKRARQIESDADASAVQRRNGADQYAREVLFHLEEQLSDALGQVRRGIDALRATETPAPPVTDKVPA